MKRIPTILILFATAFFILTASGCRKNPNSIIILPTGPEYVGEYLQVDDVLRIGHALDTAPTRTTVQWENETTGYQYSMMVFTTTVENGTTVRNFTVLSIAATQDAEVLNLVGTSVGKRIWNIVAESSGVSVGQAVRMHLLPSPLPGASLVQADEFHGFLVVE